MILGNSSRYFALSTFGQAYFARAFKSQPTPAQLLNLAQLEKTHGYSRLTQVID